MLRLTNLVLSHKALASLVLVATAVSLAGVGAFATFTSSTSVSQSVTSGTLSVTLGATGTAANRLNVSASDIAPGDTIQRAVNLSSSGTVDFASITLSTAASPSSVLDTDGTNGLQMTIDRCSVAWTEAGSSPAYTYTCGGTTSTVVASRAVIGSNIAMSNLTATTAGNTDYLRVTLTLPSSADNTFQNKSSTIGYTFTGTQRAATNK